MENRFLSRTYHNIPKPVTLECSGNCINLSIGDPDIITNQKVIDLAFEDAKNGYTRYSSFKGDPQLIAEIISYYKKEHNIDIHNDEIFVTVGASIALYMAMEAILEDGDEIIVPTPCFFPYRGQVKLAGGVCVELLTKKEDGFQINTKELESKITNRTRAIILNNPNNPTGSIQSMETLKAISEIAINHDLVVLADDIYRLYTYYQDFTPIMSLPGMKERTITINSSSKDFLMTGWRVGNVVAPSHIIDVIGQINHNLTYTPPTMSQRAYMHALRIRDTIQPPVKEEYKLRTKYVADRVNNIPFLSTLPSQGTFYVWANIEKTGLNSQEVSKKFLDEANVLVIPGHLFGNGCEDYVRIACTLNMKTLESACDRLEKLKF